MRDATTGRPLLPVPLGHVEYADGVAVQKEAARLRREGAILDRGHFNDVVTGLGRYHKLAAA